jgi:hypothetical protein
MIGRDVGARRHRQHGEGLPDILIGSPGRIRTSDQPVNSETAYPAILAIFPAQASEIADKSRSLLFRSGAEKGDLASTLQPFFPLCSVQSCKVTCKVFAAAAAYNHYSGKVTFGATVALALAFRPDRVPTVWYGPDRRSSHKSILIGGVVLLAVWGRIGSPEKTEASV